MFSFVFFKGDTLKRFQLSKVVFIYICNHLLTIFNMNKLLVLIVAICTAFIPSYSQKSKDGSKTISGSEIVNEYTHLTSDVSAGGTTIDVANSTLNSNGRFSGGLEKGDLLFVIQMQGVTIQTADVRDSSWGEVLDYNNCGLYEYVEVDEVTNGTTIELSCPLRNNYTASGKVNVIRVPRYSELNVPLNQTLTGETWNGTSGGLVVVEIDGDAVINGEVEMNAKGFRGTDGSNNNGGGLYAFNEFATTDADIGALKGEGVAGYHSDYDGLGGRYGQGAAANAGGGGLSLNAGGGGGSNIGDISSYHGWGVPDKSSNPNYAIAWTLEGNKRGIEIATKNSSGGGRGGYTLSENLEDPLVLSTWEPEWGGNERRASAAGLGGRPLDGGTGRIFLGGGGGQGHGGSWDNELLSGDGLGGAGGSGGGVVMIKVFGDLNGNGTINVNGEDGKGGVSSSSCYGAGGAGAGGTVVLEVLGNLDSLKINAKGGKGGTVTNGDISDVNRLTGPGGGGAGGVVKTSVALDSVNVSAGANGTMITFFSLLDDKFEQNGATYGATGISIVEAYIFQELTAQNDSVCIGDDALLSVQGQTVNGASVYWFDAEFGGNQIGTGLTFSIIDIQSDSTIYAGVCPGENRISVTAKAIDKSDFSIVDNSQKIICSGSSVEITANGTDFSWYPNNFINDTTLSIVSITPLVENSEFDTLKYYTQISEGNCSVIDSVTIVGVRKPLIQLPTAVGTAHGCLGSIVNLSPSHDFGSGENVTYLWDDGDGEYTGEEVPVLLEENKEIKITAIDDVYGCRDSNTFDIKVSVVGSEFFYMDTCFGDSTSFTSKATSTIGEITTSEWYIDSVKMGGADWSQESGIRKFNPAGTYTVTHINVNDLNCSDTLTKQITIRDLPNEPISLGSTIICVDQEVSFSSSYSSSEGSILMWDLGNSESSSADSGTTTYSSLGYKTIELDITDPYNCSDTIIGKVNVIDGPKANFVLPDSATYGDEINVNLSGVSGGDDFYWLSDNDTLSTSLLPKLTADKAGEICYALTVISPIGCTITNEECVIVEGEPLKLPNLFTPNGDGYNDELEVLNSDGKVVSILIYNRWGELVFKEEDYQNDWAGLSRSGRGLSTGTYFVVMKDESNVDSEPVNGFVYLVK